MGMGIQSGMEQSTRESRVFQGAQESDVAFAFFETMGIFRGQPRSKPLDSSSFALLFAKVVAEVIQILAWPVSRRAGQSGAAGSSGIYFPVQA